LLFVVVLLLLCFDCQIGLRQEKGEKKPSLKARTFHNFVAGMLRKF